VVIERIAEFLGLVVIESQMNTRNKGEIRGDIPVINFDFSVLHILWMNEFYIVNQIKMLK
jgi:hypothetical protein